ncbi:MULTISPECIES: group-specific protein [unclassified Bacillus (in: firmicutes)]|uniref:group-specific protein n=1 Tax=unclassified Bacillus (in: firmicutes) TaxID=185979 RepID=UPI001BEB1B2C|nr:MULTISPECIES: group-specific protein [unclassified Bacillus (in: firmicutes)]MBT2614265.1 group-specific protein [Bacillus sp. ISL-78]MBT2632751.1 group-specific protein [Bacillus sp. ISL-101]MBT2718620.1 group-specific protein [Bacillus sp. ISL-57]
MGVCNLNHSQQDVRLKFESQKAFLPTQLSQTLDRYLEKGNSQETMNELFHLLKKYDLSTQEEKESRNERLKRIML